MMCSSELYPESPIPYSPIPIVIWGLGLSPGAISTYGYLLSREDRKTYKCYPSYEEIGNAIGRSKRSVPEYVNELVNKRLIEVQNTMLILADGTHSNGRLEYHILNPATAVKHFNESYEARAMEEAAKTKKPHKKREAFSTVETVTAQEDNEDELPL